MNVDESTGPPKAEARACHPRKALKLLQETTAGSGWEILILSDLRPVKRRPGRRCTVRYEVEARRGELRKMLTRAFGGTLTPMLKFLIEHEGLSKEEAAELRQFVNKAGKGKK